MEYIHAKPTAQTRIKDSKGNPLPRVFRMPPSGFVLPQHGARMPLTLAVQRALKNREIETTTAEAVKAGQSKLDAKAKAKAKAEAEAKAKAKADADTKAAAAVKEGTDK